MTRWEREIERERVFTALLNGYYTWFLQDSGDIERGHGIYIYHFREDFPADFDIEKDPGIVYVNRIHKSLKSWNQDNINTAISELATFLNSKFFKFVLSRGVYENMIFRSEGLWKSMIICASHHSQYSFWPLTFQTYLLVMFLFLQHKEITNGRTEITPPCLTPLIL